MSIWNKILLGLIFVASLGFFHAATRSVKTYKYWADLTDKTEKILKKRNEEIAALKTADREHPLEDQTYGVQQLRVDLGRVLANRGRIWTKCDKKKASVNSTGITDVVVSTDEPLPSTVSDKMLVYAFEDGDDQSPGKYMGEFRVKHVGVDRQLDLASTTQMLSSLSKNVAESRKPWVLYEMMPIDEHDALATLTEEQKKLVSDEFMKDGQSVDASGKISQNPNDKRFVRPLRDYLAVFRDCEVHRTVFADRWESVQRDLNYLDAANEEAKNLLALAEKEKTKVTIEKQRAVKEYNAVAAHYADLQRMLDFNLRAFKEMAARNLETAQKIARLEKDATELIDRRTRSMAQYGPGAN
jgi:hypothetical protein